MRTALTVSQGHWRNPGRDGWKRSKKTLIREISTKPATFGSVVDVGGQSKILGWVVAGLVVVLAALTIIIVRSSTQPEPPDLTPVEVTPESTAPTDPEDSDSRSSEPTEDAASEGSEGSASDSDSGSSDAKDSSDSKEIEHSYEPVPNPPREVPDDDDDDDDADDDDDDDDDDDGGDDDD